VRPAGFHDGLLPHQSVRRLAERHDEVHRGVQVVRVARLHHLVDVPGGDRHAAGHGTAAIRLLVRYLFEELGHHRITIDPAVDNVAAVRSYGKAGFRPVGTLEAAWRDEGGEWRDLLLMELVDRERITRT